nr:ATP-binding protein [Pelovirga terrestris]
MNRLILSHISSGVMLINPQGRIRAFNLAASDITGFSLQQVYDAPAAELFPEFNKIVTPDTEPVNRAEGFFAHPSGERLSFGYATTLVKGNHGEPLGTLVTFQDLTQLKKIEEQLKRSDRLAAIGRLSAGLAHEIRNPLASISGSAQLLGENEQLSAEDKHLLTIMVKEADRLNHLLTDFLAFARPHRPQKTVVDMAVMIAELGRMLQRDLRFQEIDVQMNAAPPCQVSLDRSQIWQVLWDLSINAAEAMKGQGTLLITYAHGNPWTLTIEDSGPGIAPEIRERIFEPFFSTKDKGTGLGLSTVYSIIEAHGGTIRAERSTLGGERFIMSFPHAAGGEDDQP